MNPFSELQEVLVKEPGVRSRAVVETVVWRTRALKLPEQLKQA